MQEEKEQCKNAGVDFVDACSRLEVPETVGIKVTVVLFIKR